MKIQNVKGGYDYLPKQQIIRNYINSVIKEVFEEYGYMPIETPILCYYDILSDKYDDNSDILNEIYKLNDQGGRRLGLRYDLTVPFAKFIALNKNNISFPFKRYEINKVFRDGPVKVGRDREFTQCDADVVGIKGQLIEAELLSIYVDVFNKLDIDIVIKYNSRNLMNGLIIESGISNELVPSVTTIIDKKDKVSNDEFNKMLSDIGISTAVISKLNNYFNLDFKGLIKTFKETKNEMIKIGLEELENLNSYLTSIKINDKCQFSITLARGQNYYTGNVFEVYERNMKIGGSIGAGGRYDKIIGNFIGDGNEYPTVGISFGLSSIYELLKDSDKFNNKSYIDFYIIPINTKIESLSLANKIRRLGFKVELEMNDKRLKKCLEYADREKIKYVIIYGEDEIKKEAINIKNMSTKEYVEISNSDVSNLKNILSSI